MRYAITSVALPDLSLEETVDFVAGLGYNGLELRVRRTPEAAVGKPYSFWGNHKNDLTPENFPERATRIRQLCADSGLAIPVLASNASANDLEDLKPLAEGAARCGCPLVRVQAPRRYDGTVSYHELYAEAVESFGRAIETLAPFGVRALLEIHGGTITISAGLAYRLVSNFTPEQIGVIYDTQNMVKEGYEGVRFGLDVLGPYLAHVHVGGHAPSPGERDADGTRRWNWTATDLADGLISTPTLLAELRRVGYDGYITVEDFRQELDVKEKFRRAIQYLKGIEAP
ncbi:MAG TPA: sugar phosphate isomerase/epimerase family protein [Chloroflexota bacterium]|nr:sugar phosphate isomerase/epimerase family protein [Chloroflexota bacterium]